MEKFNKIFVNIGPNPSVNITFNDTALSEDEFEEAFKLLKRNKAPGHDGLDINIITSVYELIKEPQLKIFNELINLGIFPESMKIANVTPIFKSGKKELPINYRPISALPCFSKTLERIMYSQVHNYRNDNNLLFHKQFGFRKGHSFISFSRSGLALQKFIDERSLLHTARRVLNTPVLKNLYFSFIHSYLHYGNMVWDSISGAKFSKLI